MGNLRPKALLFACIVAGCALLSTSGAAAEGEADQVVIVQAPRGTSVADLAAIDGLAVGVMSAGNNRVPADQTYLDMSQGARLTQSLYPRDLGPVDVEMDGETGAHRVPPAQWDRAVSRAEDAPAELVPGLLGQTLRDAGLGVSADPDAAEVSLLAVDRDGQIDPNSSCGASGCSGLIVGSAASVSEIAELVGRLDSSERLIVIGSPPPSRRHELPIAIGAAEPGQSLVSDSTRLDGFVLATDVAPTVLDWLGVAKPDDMSGTVIEPTDAVDPAGAQELEDRLAEIVPRRSSVIGFNLLAWLVLAVAGAALLPRLRRLIVSTLALSIVYLPAALALTAALAPSETAERLIVGLGCPALALLTTLLAPGYLGFAIACAVTVGSYALDVILGSPLTPLSLAGTNPAAGVRFYGIGNELEAALSVLLFAGVGAACAAAPRPLASSRVAAAFGSAAFVAVVAFAPGRFGADVGAAITIPAGAAVAIAVCIGARGRRLLLIAAVPVLALLALGLVDLLLGGDSHLTRSVLDAGSLNELGDVAERRLRQGAHSFVSESYRPYLVVTVLAAIAAIAARRRIASWFAAEPAALAGLIGAVAAVVVGTIANDSGALLLVIGALFLSAYVAFAAVNAPERESDRSLAP